MSLIITPASTGADLKALREELERDRRKLDERENALNVVEQMERERQQRNQHDIPTLFNAPSSAGAPANFAESARIAVMTMGQKEFTAADVEGYFSLLGIALPADPRSRISMVLKKLRDEKTIELSHEGSGREPHRYKLAKK